MRAIKINAENKSIDVVEWETLNDIQKHVGGYIETVLFGDWMRQHKVILLVDEEGLLKDHKYGFGLKDSVLNFVGNGLIVGDNEEDFISTGISKILIENYTVFFNIEDESAEDSHK